MMNKLNSLETSENIMPATQQGMPHDLNPCS